MPPFPYHAYTVGYVSALPIELAAAEELLDEKHPSPPHDDNDSNIYTLGRIHNHNVVIAALPAGRLGHNPAAVVASRMQDRFRCIRFSLLVGVGGGVPCDAHDIRLGDVVVSQPHGGHGGVVQYDFGKSLPGRFQRTGFLSSPPDVLLHALTKLQARQMAGSLNLSIHLDRFERLPEFSRTHAGDDLLFEASYSHVDGPTCEACDGSFLVKRGARAAETVIHCGTIASGNQVMRDAITRDAISQELGGALCFEMEAAGMIASCPCLVIRGICDYADSHKNKAWQPYAAAAAAACAKEILSHIPADAESPHQDGASVIARANTGNLGPRPHSPKPTVFSTAPITLNTVFNVEDGWMESIEDVLSRETWSEVVVAGDRGSGRTCAMARIAAKFKDTHSIFWFSAKTPRAFHDGFASATDAIHQANSSSDHTSHWDCISELQLWLSNVSHGRWLLFVDDLPRDFDLGKLWTLFPKSNLGSVVMGTDLHDLAGFEGTTVRSNPVMPLDSGVGLFISVYGDASDNVAAAASGIVQAVKSHRFGIILAASFLSSHPQLSREEYLQKLTSDAAGHRDIPREVALPLFVHLNALVGTPAGYVLTVLALLHSQHIGDKVLNAFQIIEPIDSSCPEWLSAFTPMMLQQTLSALQNRFLLEVKRDNNGAYYAVPECVVLCVLQNLRDDPPTFRRALKVGLTLLDSSVSPRSVKTFKRLDESIQLVERHYTCLSRHAADAPETRGALGDFQNLGLLVALYHLGQAAKLGCNVSISRSFRRWLVRNRTLSGDDCIDPLLWDEVSPYLARHPAEPAPVISQWCALHIAGPVSSVLWFNVKNLLVFSALSRTWFTIKDDVLDGLRPLATTRRYASAAEIEDQINEAANEAIGEVLTSETEEYVHSGAQSASQSVLSSIVSLVAQIPDDEWVGLLRVSHQDLTRIILEATSLGIYELGPLAGSAWAPVLEKAKRGIITRMNSLVQQSSSIESLGKTSKFTITQLSRDGIHAYVGEVMDATWEAIRSARIWVAIKIRLALCLEMLSQIGNIPVLDPQHGLGLSSVRAILTGTDEILAEGITLLSPQYLQNWEWRAMKRQLLLHHQAIQQVLQLLDGTGNRSDPTESAFDGFW